MIKFNIYNYKYGCLALLGKEKGNFSMHGIAFQGMVYCTNPF